MQGAFVPSIARTTCSRAKGIPSTTAIRHYQGMRPSSTSSSFSTHTSCRRASVLPHPLFLTVALLQGQAVGRLTKCDVVLPKPMHDGHDQKIIIDGSSISFDFFAGAPGSPVVFFLQGFFYSNNRRTKASALEIFAKRAHLSFFVADYYGTGLSDGDFANHGTLSIWISHAVAIIERLFANRPVLLCGAGIGAWIMLHVAQHRRNVIGLVGVNASVDFTEDLIRPGLTEEQKRQIEQTGFVDLPWGRTSYPIGRALLEDAVHWLCLRGPAGSLGINCPVRLIQGLNDEEVPPSRVLKLVDMLASDNVVVSFVKGADHIFEEECDLRRLWSTVVEIADGWYEYDLTSPGSG